MARPRVFRARHKARLVKYYNSNNNHHDDAVLTRYACCAEEGFLFEYNILQYAYDVTAENSSARDRCNVLCAGACVWTCTEIVHEQVSPRLLEEIIR